MEQKKISATEVLESVVNQSSSDRVLVKDMVDAMQETGFGLIVLIFSLGIMIPLPPPFPSIISLPLVLFSWQMVKGARSPQLPKKFSNLSVKRSVLAMLARKSAVVIGKIEKFLRPRLHFATTPKAERVVGFFIFLFASFILVPMPLSNFIPGLGIVIISFGMISKDGLMIILGVLIGLVGVAISITAVLLGAGAIYALKNYITAKFFLN